jgi:two-component system sensor histidine kinase CiaH
MFHKARIKLTGWYLLIIMAISLSFSVAIYAGINNELVRINNSQRARQERVETINTLLKQKGLPMPPESQIFEPETIDAARVRIISILGLINLSIVIISGLGQKEFVGNASHELRTPLTSLKTEIEVSLRDKNMSVTEYKKLLKSNLEDVNSMQKLSNYLLELNRYTNSDYRPDIAKVDLAKVVSLVIKKIGPIANKNKIKILANLQKTNVSANSEALVELSTILIENAIKYSGESKKIEVNVLHGGKLEVKDFGVGISKADLPYIFDRFYRAESSRSKEKVDGYGLGLSIAKSIVDKLGGKIKVVSREGKGSTFIVQIPTA